LLALASEASAQTADDYFHGGAQSYVFGENKKAEDQVFTGLTKYPDDAKLNGLAVLLKKKEEEQKQQEQQQQQNQSKDEQKKENKDSQSKQNPSDQNKDGQDKKEDQQQQASQSEQQKKEQEKKEQEQKEQQQKEEQQKREEQEKQQAKQSPEQPKDNSAETNQTAQAYALGQMTPEQAQQLLDAQKEQEKLVPIKPVAKPTDRTRPIRDW